MPLHQLIYASRPFGYDANMLANILETAQRRNAMDGITGALICRRDLYCQLLEGPVGKVENCFARIEQDDRHVEVQVLLRAAVQDRLFPGWAMFHDPQHRPLWSREAIHDGALRRAHPQDVRAVFLPLAETASL